MFKKINVIPGHTLEFVKIISALLLHNQSVGYNKCHANNHRHIILWKVIIHKHFFLHKWIKDPFVKDGTLSQYTS